MVHEVVRVKSINNHVEDGEITAIVQTKTGENLIASISLFNASDLKINSRVAINREYKSSVSVVRIVKIL